MSVNNENDPEYDEDAAMCRCGHTFRDHWGRAFSYACAAMDCPCNGFQQAPPTGVTKMENDLNTGETNA